MVSFQQRKSQRKSKSRVDSFLIHHWREPEALKIYLTFL
jgi:hypothetical protein